MRKLLLALSFCVASVPAAADSRLVSTSGDFIAAVRNAKPGDTIRLAPGSYSGGFHFPGLRGEPGRPIIIAAAESARPPDITSGMHFSDPNYLELRDLTIRGVRGNGINIDDGGTAQTPSRHVTLLRIRVLDSGSGGNQDAIKLSGLDDFVIKDCQVVGWSEGGSAIDMVGCHRGRIEKTLFRRGGSNAVQAKGGSSEITIQGCRFEDFGQRGVNIGGSTGMDYFRPPVSSMPPNGKYEAKDITVQDCVFTGGVAPIAFVGVDGAAVRNCTIYRPSRWAVRILQETRDPGFVPSRMGIFEQNIIVFRSNWGGAVNAGVGTSPESFKFRDNVWYCEDRPQRSRPDLPAPESHGMYGVDPLLRNAAVGDFRLQPASPARGKGAANAAAPFQ